MLSFIAVFKEVVSCNSFAKARFVSRFWREVIAFSRAFRSSYNSYARTFIGEKDKQEATVKLFLLNAYNGLLLSTNLLVQGMLVPSGNLMRNFSESVAAALIFSSRQLGYYRTYEADIKAFSVNKAIEYLSRPKTISALDLERSGIDTFKQISKFYDSYSHPTPFSLSPLFNLSRGSRMFIGATFDAKRKIAYEVELKRRIGACGLLTEIVFLSKGNVG